VDLQLTDDQELLGQAIRSMLARDVDEMGLIAPTQSSGVWERLVEFGALSIGSNEDELGAIELALIARELGERLAETPFVDTAAVRYAFASSPLVASPETIFAVGLNEPGTSFAPADPVTVLRDGTVTGVKSSVLGALRADVIVITAAGSDGPVVAAISPTHEGVHFSDQLTLDPSTRSTHLVLEGVPVSEVTVMEGLGTQEQIERLCAIGAVLSAAESVGAAAELLRRARDYAAERIQFGRTIGSFQALRHIMADMYVKVEGSWSSVLYAAASLDEQTLDGPLVASIAKAFASRTLVDVAHDALQVFGGIAFTYEHPAHRFLRRIVALSDQYGRARDHEVLVGRALAAR